MILAFRQRGLKRLYEDGDATKLIPEHVDRIRLILAALDSAQTPRDMGTHTFALHLLKGDRRGEWAVTVRANWRITFRFKGANAVDVDLEDYH